MLSACLSEVNLPVFVAVLVMDAVDIVYANVAITIILFRI